MNKNSLFLLNIIFLICSNIYSMELSPETTVPNIKMLDTIPTEIMHQIITSHVLECLHNNPSKPDISLLTTAAQLNKNWAISMVALYKQLIERGAQLAENTHFWYAKNYLKTPIAQAIADFNKQFSYLFNRDESQIIIDMNTSYFILNFISFDGDSHMSTACLHKNYLAIKNLLQRDAIITPKDFVRCCPHLSGDDEDNGIACATLLVEKDPSLINKIPSSTDYTFDYTLLSQSARYGKNKMVKFLIERKADVNIANSYDGFTPLHNAILNSHKKSSFCNLPSTTINTVQLLIAAGADPLKKTNYKDHPDCDAYDLVKKFHTKDNNLTPFGQQLVKELRKSRAVERSKGTAHYMGTVSTVDNNT